MRMQSLWSDSLMNAVRQLKASGASEFQNKLSDHQFNLSLALSTNEKKALTNSLGKSIVTAEGRTGGYWG